MLTQHQCWVVPSLPLCFSACQTTSCHTSGQQGLSPRLYLVPWDFSLAAALLKSEEAGGTCSLLHWGLLSTSAIPALLAGLAVHMASQYQH